MTCLPASRSKLRARPRSSSRASTNKWLARWLPKFVRTVRRNLTRARACVMTTKRLSSRKPRRSKGEIMDKKESRLRRARRTRLKIAELKMARLAVHRTNSHIYAQIFSGCGTQVLAAASTAEQAVRTTVANGGNVAAAAAIGKLIAERAKAKGVEEVAFDRSGFRYHGRVKALAEAAREGGLKF